MGPGVTLVDLFASQSHYAEHLRPIWDALPDELRGQSWSASRGAWWGERSPRPLHHHVLDRLTLVAGWTDAARCAGRLVYVEHGTGQTYRELRDHPSYSGGVHRAADVAGYLCPSEQVARRWLARGGHAHVVGCPKLDRWLPSPPRPQSRTIAITAHWDCRLTSETRAALPHFTARGRLAATVARWQRDGWHVVGHAHPRARAAARQLWTSMGVEFEPDAAAVLERASLLVADNTSLLYEHAALGRPVLVLNAPWYRRDVEHGLRFWSHVPGQQIDGPDELDALDVAHYVDADPSWFVREVAVGHAYAVRDGTSAARAADVVARIARGG